MKSYISRKLPLETRITFLIFERREVSFANIVAPSGEGSGGPPQFPMIPIQYVMRAKSLQAENESAARLSQLAIPVKDSRIQEFKNSRMPLLSKKRSNQKSRTEPLRRRGRDALPRESP